MKNRIIPYGVKMFPKKVISILMFDVLCLYLHIRSCFDFLPPYKEIQCPNMKQFFSMQESLSINHAHLS